MKTVRYNGNDKETYTLFVGDEEVAELLTGEDGAIEMVEVINNYLKKRLRNDETLVIQNDADKLGVIVDRYLGDDWINGITLWFDDFIN